MHNIIKEIEAKKTNFKSDSYAMSIGELVNLYEDEEIIIRPEYQRLFRWTHSQKVNLIESILLGIPIPSIFVYQDDKGIWELVDGLQRVSTILQLFGVLIDEEPLVLKGTKYIPSLEGYSWKNDNEPEKELPQSIKLAIKRAKISLTIILSESDPRAKFEVFQRLNTGGSNASNQEVRNNIMIMISPAKYDWFHKLSSSENFQNTISLSDRLYDEQYHMELLLRFIGLTYYDYDRKKDIGDFLDEINEELLNNDSFDFDKVEDEFMITFSTLNNILGDKAFKKFNGGDFKGKFLESAFESISVGLASNISDYELPEDEHLIRNKIQDLYSQETYNQTSGSGSNAKTRIPKLIPFVKDFFKKNG